MIKLSKDIFINMEKEIFKGNLLDIGMDNQGIIYNIYKEFNDNINVEYVSGKEEGKNIKDDYYDNCILLFSFNKLWVKFKKKNFIKDIHSHLAKNGIIHIWDIDKWYGKIFNADIKILIPGGKLRKIKIRDFNILKDNSKESTIRLLNNYFKILECRNSDGLYYIKAEKKNLVCKS